MNICENYHEQIVFDGRDCPLCEANKKIEELENDLTDQKDENQKLVDEKIKLEISQGEVN